jgi:hypothetical protein
VLMRASGTEKTHRAGASGIRRARIGPSSRSLRCHSQGLDGSDFSGTSAFWGRHVRPGASARLGEPSFPDEIAKNSWKCGEAPARARGNSAGESIKAISVDVRLVAAATAISSVRSRQERSARTSTIGSTSCPSRPLREREAGIRS